MPVLLPVAFNAFIPLMAVVNYSLQETFGDSVFLSEGIKRLENVLRSHRFHDSLLRQPTVNAVILAIEVPLGIAVDLALAVGWFILVFREL